MAPHAPAEPITELIMNVHPGAIVTPGEGLIGRLPMRPVMRQQALGTAGAQDILEAIHHLAQGVCAGSITSFFRRQKRLQDVPLLVGEIRGVGQAPGGSPSWRRIDHVPKQLNAHDPPF